MTKCLQMSADAPQLPSARTQHLRSNRADKNTLIRRWQWLLSQQPAILPVTYSVTSWRAWGQDLAWLWSTLQTWRRLPSGK